MKLLDIHIVTSSPDIICVIDDLKMLKDPMVLLMSDNSILVDSIPDLIKWYNLSERRNNTVLAFREVKSLFNDKDLSKILLTGVDSDDILFQFIYRRN
jgi:hypothetical protein